MAKKKVYIVRSSPAYENLFGSMGWKVLSSFTEDVPDLICFTGGEDVSPHLYGERVHPHTFCNTLRDNHEKNIAMEAIEMGIPMVGICRGGQFLNVINGGKMFQHVASHTFPHLIKDEETGQQLIATSTHHQMMRPGPSAIVVATAKQGGFRQHMGDNGIINCKPDIDIEAVFYPNTSSLCFQPHPEFYGEEELKEYFFSLINRFINL